MRLSEMKKKPGCALLSPAAVEALLEAVAVANRPVPPNGQPTMVLYAMMFDREGKGPVAYGGSMRYE